jgi:hypothetical protein
MPKVRDVKYKLNCTTCKKEREVTYCMKWNIDKGYNSGNCMSCSAKIADNSGHFKKGVSTWNKGLKGFNAGHKSYVCMEGEDNPNWKGDGAGYIALHYWVRRKLGNPVRCSKNKSHSAKRFVWANISGEYKRDLNDWRSFCNSCNLTDGVAIRDQFDENLHRRISYATL